MPGELADEVKRIHALLTPFRTTNQPEQLDKANVREEAEAAVP